jgi:hypothetical protein
MQRLFLQVLFPKLNGYSRFAQLLTEIESMGAIVHIQLGEDCVWVRACQK